MNERCLASGPASSILFLFFTSFDSVFLKSPRAEIRTHLNRLQLGAEEHFSPKEIFMPETPEFPFPLQEQE